MATVQLCIINSVKYKQYVIHYSTNSKTTLMYIDHLKRGAGGILSHDEGYFGSQKGSVPFRNDLETTLP